MNKKNNTLKTIVLTAIISIVLTASITVTAISLSAKEIGFTSKDENWQVDNVEDAMNDLYELGINSGIKKTFSVSAGGYQWLPGSYGITVQIADMDIEDGEYDAVLSCSSAYDNGLATVTSITGGEFKELKSLQNTAINGAGSIASSSYNAIYLGKVNVVNGTTSVEVVFTQSVNGNIPYSAILTVLA